MDPRTPQAQCRAREWSQAEAAAKLGVTQAHLSMLETGRRRVTPNMAKRLLDVYGSLLRTWLSRSGVSPGDHDDLIQEVLMVVVRRVSEFEHRGPGAFRAWLRGILANHLKKYFRDRPPSSPAIALRVAAIAASSAARSSARTLWRNSSSVRSVE